MNNNVAPERSVFTDEKTGVRITQWTNFPAMHHHFYFTNSSISRDGKVLFGVHYRFRYPNIFTIDTLSGVLRTLTDNDDINPFSCTPDKAGDRVFYSARDEIRVVEVATGRTDVLCRFGDGRLGNCSLSHNDKWLSISRRTDTCQLLLIDVETGTWNCLTEKAEVGHMQFHPHDASLLEYSGSPSQRIWTIRSDGSQETLLYPQRSNEWIVHESWSADGGEIIFSHWPHALRAVSYPDGKVRTIAAINAWHAWSNPHGKTIVCDTNHPDRGLLLIDSRSGTWKTLCTPSASSQGTQWKENLPAAGAGIDTSIIRGENPAADPAPHFLSPASLYGPQWTHPHPTFSPDGTHVIYTSDRGTGWSQIYSCAVPATENLPSA